MYSLQETQEYNLGELRGSAESSTPDLGEAKSIVPSNNSIPSTMEHYGLRFEEEKKNCLTSSEQQDQRLFWSWRLLKLSLDIYILQVSLTTPLQSLIHFDYRSPVLEATLKFRSGTSIKKSARPGIQPHSV